ncbi:helix-turn-helix domain-containing protein [Ekhidna sp. To15]|uniref:helix-turn-helix domain-containing protein n=1 Tax=Ekhidna sp. To15 TaxID=3395267 RepID=UPI003F51BCA0
MSWEIILFLAAAINGIIISTLFLLDRRNLRRVFLGIYLLCFSVTILYYVNYWTQAFQLHPILLWLGIVSSWLMPFSFYYYMKADGQIDRLWLHLIIPVVFTIYWVTANSIPLSNEFRQVARPIVNSTQLALFLAYGLALLRSKAYAKENIIFYLPYTSFILGLAAYHLSLALGFYTLRLDYIICGGFVILTYGITYLSEFSFLKDKVKPKYSSSSLTKEDGDYLVQKINDVLEQNKYYQDPDFNLSSFAEKLGVPKYRISQSLNAFSEKSFSELINEFRIEDAKVRLQQASSNHLKLEAIGEEVGFRNKVSFYKNFKKLVGSSPGEFREDHLEKSA